MRLLHTCYVCTLYPCNACEDDAMMMSCLFVHLRACVHVCGCVCVCVRLRSQDALDDFFVLKRFDDGEATSLTNLLRGHMDTNAAKCRAQRIKKADNLRYLQKSEKLCTHEDTTIFQMLTDACAP
jgi:hypothetical protein